MTMRKKGALAGIEYHGIPGTSKPCKEAVIRLIQSHEWITFARLLTCGHSHCLVLTLGESDLVAIKSGFASGYGGEGPAALSYVLDLLHTHQVEVEEILVNEELMERVDASALSTVDVKEIESARPIRPVRWHDYISKQDWMNHEAGMSWGDFRPVIPFAILDPRIADLALRFWDQPDDALLVGYRRLEDIVRARTQLDEHGARLFSQAFLGDGAKLRWQDLEDRARQGRGTLFTAVYQGYRNPRAHRELGKDAHNTLAEFLMLNQLYRLEKAAEAVSSEITLDDPKH